MAALLLSRAQMRCCLFSCQHTNDTYTEPGINTHRGKGSLETQNFLSPKLGGPSRPKIFQVQNQGGYCWLKFFKILVRSYLDLPANFPMGGGPISWKFSKSKNPNKIKFFLRSDLDLPANFPMGGGVALGHTSQTHTHWQYWSPSHN